ncbi:MAG: ribbon-helix-helix protein, CopG family [Dehalococcoidia bacterium]|nr:ribbon-helix-helix protein, CopG family [Dehalococcoidia bacterium]
MRTIVDLPEEQLRWLAELCKRDGISRAEAIRRVLADARHRDLETPRRDSLDEIFGLWRDRNIDALEYERALREEFER